MECLSVIGVAGFLTVVLYVFSFIFAGRLFAGVFSFCFSSVFLFFRNLCLHAVFVPIGVSYIGFF